MSADLHIHIYEGITEEDMKTFFSNTLGSKYFDPSYGDRNDEVYEKIAKTPNIWIGGVSWLKAALFEDDEHFIPSTVERVQDVVGEDLPILDDKLIKEVIDAFDLENKTGYALAKKEDVEKFLIENKGKRVFTVSW